MSADTGKSVARDHGSVEGRAAPGAGKAQISDCTGEGESRCSQRPQYNTVQEYTRSLQRWIRDYHSYQAAQHFYSMMPMFMSSPGFMGPASAPSRQPFSVRPGFTSPRAAVPHTGSQHRGTTQQGRVYLLPSVWKRLAAELIDFLILFYIKLIVSVGVMRQMGILESDNIELQGFYKAIILTPDDVDLEKLLSLSSEIIALEIVNRLCISIVEALCLRRGVGGVVGGATPGKRILGLCVVRCEESTDAGHGRVHVAPATDIGFKRALVRSLIKNFTMAFFFPACLTLFLFRHNRAAYDIIPGTIVVQSPDHVEAR